MGSCQYFSSRRLATNTALVRRSNAQNGACSAPPSWYRSGGVHAGCWRGAAAVVGPGSSRSCCTESVWRAAAWLTTSRCRREPQQPAEAPEAGAGRRLGADRSGRFFLPLPVSRLHACPHPASAWHPMAFGSSWPLIVHPRPARQGCAPPCPPAHSWCPWCTHRPARPSLPPSPLRRWVIYVALTALAGLRRHQHWRVRDGAHGRDNQLAPPGDRNPTLKHPPAPF